MTTWTFAYTSSAINLYMIYESYGFYKHANSKSAKKLFFSSIVHLPILLTLLLLHKNNRKPIVVEDHEADEIKLV